MAKAKRTNKPRPSASAGVAVQKQSWNVYTTMLLLALLGIIVACIALAIELRDYEGDYKAKGATKTVRAQWPAANVASGSLLGSRFGQASPLA
jgi:hypothetical protein